MHYVAEGAIRLNNQIWRVGILAVAVLLALSACGVGVQQSAPNVTSIEESIDENYPVTVGGITLEAKPEVVVTLSPGLTELVCDLGYAQQLAGATDYCTREDDSMRGVVRVGTVLNLDIGAIKRLKPDLVLTAAPLTIADADVLLAAGIPVALLPRAQSIAELEALWRDIGRAMSGAPVGEEAALRLFEAQLARLEAVKAKVTRADGTRPEVCYLRELPLMVATGGTMECELLERAGFACSGAQYRDWSYPEDKKAELAPDIILYNKNINAAVLAEDSLYNKTPAYKNGKAIPIDMELFERQGIHMFEVLEKLA